MNKYFILFYLTLFSAQSCTNNTSEHSSNQNIDSVKPGSNAIEKKEEIVDSLKVYDKYQYENDTILQIAYIHYLAPRKIKFILTSKNKTSLHVCQFSDTALMPDNTDGIAQGRDDNYELYDEYEYFMKKPYVEIGIECIRGKRVGYAVNDSMMLCHSDCPLSSVGTLILEHLSNQKQNNPTFGFK